MAHLFWEETIQGLPHATVVVGSTTTEALTWVGNCGVSPFDTVLLNAHEEGGIKEVRSFTNQLLLSPQFGGVRLGIVLSAQVLTPQAQNALLKLLEEPPETVKIILFAATEADLLPTVLSRCRKYYAQTEMKTAYKPYNDDQIAQFLAAEALAKDEELATIAKQWLIDCYAQWCNAGRPAKQVAAVERFWRFYKAIQRPSANKRLLLEQLVVSSL